MFAPVEVFIGLGSNLGDPKEQLRAGLEGLTGIPGYTPLAFSSPYVTAPVGPVEQAPFLNAVARGMFGGGKRGGERGGAEEAAHELLGHLMAIEKARGRRREVHWGPRTLDLDILLFGDHIIETPRLKAPHPGIPERAFVLVPLMELAPDFVLPLWNQTAAQLFDQLSAEEKSAQQIEKVKWVSGAL